MVTLLPMQTNSLKIVKESIINWDIPIFVVSKGTTMNRIEREKQTVSQMIRLYCRLKENNKELCCSCAELEAYAHKRLSACKYGNNKTACQKCPTHCYKKDMREKIREVMRFAGPRMIFHAPIAALRHLLNI